jgi:hypothetical protein
MGAAFVSVASLKTRRGLEPIEQPGDEVLKGTANPVFTGEHHGQPRGQQCTEKGRSRHG